MLDDCLENVGAHFHCNVLIFYWLTFLILRGRRLIRSPCCLFAYPLPIFARFIGWPCCLYTPDFFPYAASVTSKESRRLILLSTSCLFIVFLFSSFQFYLPSCVQMLDAWDLHIAQFSNIIFMNFANKCVHLCGSSKWKNGHWGVTRKVLRKQIQVLFLKLIYWSCSGELRLTKCWYCTHRSSKMFGLASMLVSPHRVNMHTYY
jgi:hypothetical protein